MSAREEEEEKEEEGGAGRSQLYRQGCRNAGNPLCERERERERDLTVYHVFIVQGIVEFVDVVDVVA